MNYIDNLKSDIKRYFDLLEPVFPEWLNEYINTPVLLKQQYISVTCATIYSDLFKSNFFYSNLDHSIGVALIIWHFTHDKAQTLSWLFHDIATPVFKHCIDYLYGDYETQETTEELTTKIIKSSKELMNLLKRDNIKIDQVSDYHKYPIADNDTPFLSADRLEYSLSNALFTYNYANLNDISKIYNDITIEFNEQNEIELGFQDENIALLFVKITTKLSIIYRSDETRYTMQFIADITNHLITDKIITIDDLYKLKEKEVIEKIENSKYKNIFEIWKKTNKVSTSISKPNQKYFINQKSKIRYINPLVNNVRINNINKEACKLIKDNLSYDMTKYVFIDKIEF